MGNVTPLKPAGNTRRRHSPYVGFPLRNDAIEGSRLNLAQWFKNTFTGIPTLYSGNPVKEYLTSSSLGNVGKLTRDVKFVNNTYYCYEERDNSGVWVIEIRTSFDGINWTQKGNPIFAAGAAGSYDELGQADPSVIYDGPGDWKMWYDAKRVGTPTTEWDYLGYATSTDGLTWTKYGAVIKRGEPGTWDEGVIHHNSVIKYNGTYYMYYTGAIIPSKMNIGLATSTDGINWTKYGTAPVIPFGSGGDNDATYCRPSMPMLIYGTWYMFYWGYDGSHHTMLATSTDLYTWTKRGKVLDGPQATAFICDIGTNPKDVLLKMWFYNTGSPAGTCFANIAIPNAFTKLAPFIPTNAYTTAYGDTTSNDSSSAYAGGYFYLHRVTASAAITPDAINLYVSNYLKPNTGTIKCALYANGTNTPTTLLGTTVAKSWSDVKGKVWTRFAFVTPPVLTAADYWIAIYSDQAYYKNKAAGGSNNFGNKASADGVFPSTMSATTNQAFSDMDACLVAGSNENIWQIALTPEPTKVYFNSILGTKKSSLATITDEFDWWWSTNVLYIRSVRNPNVRYQIAYE